MYIWSRFYGQFILSNASPINITAVVTDVTCFGGTDGGININVEGGTSSYNYDWSNNTYFQDLNNISNGTYTVTITDGNDCEEIE